MSRDNIRQVVGWVFDELEPVRAGLHAFGIAKYRRAIVAMFGDDDPILCCLLLICCESRADAIEKVTERAYARLNAA